MYSPARSNLQWFDVSSKASAESNAEARRARWRWRIWQRARVVHVVARAAERFGQIAIDIEDRQPRAENRVVQFPIHPSAEEVAGRARVLHRAHVEHGHLFDRAAATR